MAERGYSCRAASMVSSISGFSTFHTKPQWDFELVVVGEG